VTVEVRPIRDGEHAALGDLTVAAYAALEGGEVLDTGYEAELRDVAGRLAAGDAVLVAVEDGRLLGGITYVAGPSSPSAEFEGDGEVGVRMLAVDPAGQRRGVGTALAAACVDLARARGARRIVLHSTPWMAGAHRLYERLGFRRAPERDFLPVPSIPLLGFVMDLDEEA
jgi:ribosomal protein S18 acetylase RimI-like enzyme